MKKLSILILYILIFLSAKSQQYNLWGTLQLNDNYGFYTYSSNNYYQQELQPLYQIETDISKITCKKNDTLMNNANYFKELACRYQQLLTMNNDPGFKLEHWILDSDIFNYYDNFWIPTGSYEETDPDFIDYIEEHAIEGLTTAGLDNYQHRIEIYKRLIFNTIIPDNSDFSEFDNMFNSNYLNEFNNAINNTNSYFASAGMPTFSPIAGMNELFQCLNNQFLDDIAQVNPNDLDKIPNLKNFQNEVLINKNILSGLSIGMNVISISSTIFEEKAKAMVYVVLANAEARMRLNAWQRFIDENINDAALDSAFYLAKNEFEDYASGDIMAEIWQNVLNNSNFWSSSIGLVSGLIPIIKSIAMPILSQYVTLGAISSVCFTVVSYGLIVVPIAYQTWAILNEEDELLEAVVGAATLERTLLSAIPADSINNINDLVYISILTNIRQSLAFLFYANFSDRVGMMQNWYLNVINPAYSENVAQYQSYLTSQRNLSFQFFSEYRPDIFPVDNETWSFIKEKCYADTVLDVSTINIQSLNTSTVLNQPITLRI